MAARFESLRLPFLMFFARRGAGARYPKASLCRRAGATALLCAVLGACIERFPASTHSDPAPPPSIATVATVVTIDPGERHQTLEGFGASIAWHMDKVVGAPPDGIYDVLFPELGLDILRFRNRYARSKPEDRNLDEEVEILRRATAALGHPPKLLLSSWSPPASLKADGHEDCHGNGDCTLARENGAFVYGKFARYWADSLHHYAELGIAPDYITIENEPSFIPPKWEGCKFTPSETADYPGFDRALASVHEELARMSPPLSRRPKILAPEVLGIQSGLLQSYLAPMDISLVDGVAHHLYQKGPDNIWTWRHPGPDAFVDEMRGVAAATSQPLYQTECQTDEDRGIDGGFETAWLIHLSMVEEGVVAFFYWSLVWDHQGGLVSVNGSKYKIHDQYYALKHYARFTDPGDVRVGARSGAASIKASAFLSPAGDRMTVVVLNTGASDAQVKVDPGGFSSTRQTAYRTVFRPGASETWSTLPIDAGAPPTPSAAPLLTLPSRSIATLVLAR